MALLIQRTLEILIEKLSEISLLPLGLTVLLTYFLWNLSSSKNKRLPPGPFQFPVLGSVFIFKDFVDSVRRHPLKISLPKIYGKLISFRIGGTTVIWINDLDTIKEAFITKGDVLSDRVPPDNPTFMSVGGELAKYSGLGIGETNYGQEYKERKHLTLQCMKEFGGLGLSLEELVSAEAQILVAALRLEVEIRGKETDIHQRIIHLAVSNVICSVAFGNRYEYDDPSFLAAVNGIRFLFSGQRGRVISRIPFAKYYPSVRRLLEREVSEISAFMNFVDEQIRLREKSYDPAEEPASFVDLYLQKCADISEENETETIGVSNVKKIIMDLFSAGTDTTSTALLWFLLLMIRYPEVQCKCREEIEGLGESFTNATLSRDSITKRLPFTTASLLEAQRIGSVAGASVPHLAKVDTSLSGYFIPKGALVTANIRFVHFDESYWQNPHEFDPSRWLKEDAGGDKWKVIQHSHFIPFSVGKRRCLGENLAKTEYLVFGVSLLQNFKFCSVGEEPPSLEGRGLLHAPHPFKMFLEPCS